ncbi:MAG TPA: hypothetical protein PLI68_13355 [Bacteroidia bacterium]|nr:hypothetical protein [Bacteroidia bacterium]HRH07299.1 hypothetical protein [Bacteroidia bacterium]HRH64302.1 hypothetical protein [Bacteroidia bacterium]
MKIKLLLSGFLLLFYCSQSKAQTATPKVKHKQEQQQKKIAQGVKNGELTPAEAEKLERQQRKIQHDKRMAKADGVVTPKERAKIHHEQKRAGKHIAKEKHDPQHR